MHREFNLPAQGLDDAGGGDFVPIDVIQHNLQMRALLKRSHLNIDVQPVTIRVGLGVQRCNTRFFGGHPLKMVFREKEIHPPIITKRKRPSSHKDGRLRYSTIRWLTILFLEFFHEMDQGFRPFNGHGVINRSAHAADRAMSFQTDQVVLLGRFGEGVF